MHKYGCALEKELLVKFINILYCVLRSVVLC